MKLSKRTLLVCLALGWCFVAPRAVTVAQAKGPVKFLIPTQGWCSFDREGGSVYAPDEDKAFTEELKRNLKPEVEVIEVEANLEEPAFAAALVDALVGLLPANK